MKEDGNFVAGVYWGTLLSVPLWLAFFGWVKIIKVIL
jgi:hypothetical protein